MKKVTEKIDDCTICVNLRLVKRYKDEWVCDVCAARLNGLKGTGEERIAALREELYPTKPVQHKRNVTIGWN